MCRPPGSSAAIRWTAVAAFLSGALASFASAERGGAGLDLGSDLGSDSDSGSAPESDSAGEPDADSDPLGDAGGDGDAAW
ncbi:hypothetical protein SHKM778_27790 [Streptomyces sp. KM77-8]|uniref:Uncharacterized protein n=1 Tax=Streptomyces haneummycinicus TaxID=3074435 RepID=A0AAT9HGB3_9ACTN